MFEKYDFEQCPGLFRPATIENPQHKNNAVFNPLSSFHSFIPVIHHPISKSEKKHKTKRPS